MFHLEKKTITNLTALIMSKAHVKDSGGFWGGLEYSFKSKIWISREVKF